MLSAPSQLLLRHRERLPAGTLLLIDPPADETLRELSTQHGLAAEAFTQDFAVARALEAGRFKVAFGAEPPPASGYDRILVFHPKERSLADLLLFLARSRLATDGAIWLVGENKGGIRATEKRLRAAGIAVDKIDSARHCQLLRITSKSAGAEFRLLDWLEVVAVEIAGIELAVASLPGVFSAGTLDEGTALLLESFREAPAGRVLDMGCGAGVIGAFLKKKYPSLSVDMVDTNALALLATENTLKENALSATVYPSDGFSAVKGTFELIVSNPPFHDGLATDHRFFERFIAEAPQFLRPGGRIRIVANAHLHYVPRIEASFGNCQKISETTRFRVYEATRPNPPSIASRRGR